MTSVYFCWIAVIVLVKCVKVISTTRVSLTAPLNPVKEDGMLAFHCQVWDLSDEETVTIYRWIGDQSATIFWQDDILNSVDDRAYLAKRILSDGSVVYFLSITGITQSDQGVYSCEVLARTDSGFSRIAIGSVTVKVQYYPNNEYPKCTSNVPSVILSGTKIALNCTSEQGFPTVSLIWKRTGSDVTSDAQFRSGGSVVFSELYLDVSLSDKDAVFLCQMKSVVFPNLVQSCHIGPLMVIADPLQTEVQPAKDHRLPTHGSIVGEGLTTEIDVYDETVGTDRLHCQSVCSKMSSNLSVWRIATIIASAIALVMLVIGIAIYVKIYKESAYTKKRRSQQPITRQPVDCLYEELKYRQDNEGNKVYMALVRPRKPDSLAVAVRGVDFEGNYTLTPTTLSNVSTCQLPT